MSNPVPLRSDGDVVAGVLRLRLGGQARQLRELLIEENERWQEELARSLATTLSHVETIKDWEQAVSVASTSMPMMIDLIVAYDVDDELGGREWLRKHATPSEIYAAFKEIALASYPFGRDLSRFPMLIGTLMDQVAKVATAAALSRSMSSPPRPTGGSRKKSGAA